MSTICLIRHGQASAHKADYDQLSELGYAQSRAAGVALEELIPNPTSVWVGPCKRHRQTAEQLIRVGWPEAHWDVPFLDEFPAFELMTDGLGQLRELRPDLAPEIDSINGILGTEGSSYATVLQAITQEWVNGHLLDPRWISGPQYLSRLQEGLQSLFDRPGRHILVTSTGTIASLIGLSLDAAPDRSIRCAWALKNASFSYIRYTSPNDRFLAGMNHVDHLQPAQQTHL